MKNLLFLSLRLPYPPHRGDRIRAFHFIRGLQEKYRIALAAFFEKRSELDNLGPLREMCAEIYPAPHSAWKGRARAAASLFGNEPLQNAMWRSTRMADAVRKAIDESAPDAVHASLFRMGRYVAEEPLPKLLDLCDSMAMNLRRRMERERNPLNRPLLKIEEKRARRYEAEIIQAFDRTVVIAADDRDAIHETAPDARLDIVSQGVDLDYFSPSRPERNGPPTILFTGTMNYFPNTDAAMFLVHDTLPKVREAFPDARLILAGTSPPRPLRRLNGRSGVVVTGAAPDLRPYFEEADIFAAPMFCGSGVQTKNLEAMAMKLPVVTTPLGRQGCGARNGHELLEANDQDKFAQEVISLLKDRDRQRALADAGRRYVEREHGWGVITEKLCRLYDEIL